VLHARNGIEELELGQNLGLDITHWRQSVEPHDRGVADGLGDRVEDAPPPRARRGAAGVGLWLGRGVLHYVLQPWIRWGFGFEVIYLRGSNCLHPLTFMMASAREAMSSTLMRDRASENTCSA